MIEMVHMITMILVVDSFNLDHD